jgi:hypothetical protein
MSRLRSRLYKWARLLGTVEAIASGNPKRILRRAVNVAIGRGLVAKLWR